MAENNLFESSEPTPASDSEQEKLWSLFRYLYRDLNEPMPSAKFVLLGNANSRTPKSQWDVIKARLNWLSTLVGISSDTFVLPQGRQMVILPDIDFQHRSATLGVLGSSDSPADTILTAALSGMKSLSDTYDLVGRHVLIGMSVPGEEARSLEVTADFYVTSTIRHALDWKAEYRAAAVLPPEL